jgi:Arc/MetJ-type ribon-helix-helix transcriptional regulator
MEVTLTAEQQSFIHLAVADGRLHNEEEAISEALALWEERERGRIAFLATLADARQSLARGEGRELTEDSLRELSASVKERGRTRLAAELAKSA